MKKLKDHIILYDAVCPLCSLYTKGFIDAGMLDKNGRLPYQDLPQSLACTVDQKRYVNEIALVDTRSGTVYYGVNSLLKITGHSFPALARLFRLKPLFKAAVCLYKFISFNRRVILPSKRTEDNTAALEPAFHRGYRLAFLLFTVLFTSIVLSAYNRRLEVFLPAGDIYREIFICGGQIVWQAVVIFFLKKSSRWNYLGNLMTISFAGALLLLAGMGVGRLFAWQQPMLYAGIFGMVVFAMFLEHIRRTRLLGLDWRVTASWVAYRLLVLFIILSPLYV